MEADLNEYFRSIIDQNDAPVVICNTEPLLMYRNPAAVERSGGKAWWDKASVTAISPRPKHA